MADRSELPLHEEVLLLALRDDRGPTPVQGHCLYALGGAIIAERLRPVRLGDDAAPADPRTVILASLAAATFRLAPVLEGSGRKAARARIARSRKGGAGGALDLRGVIPAATSAAIPSAARGS